MVVNIRVELGSSLQYSLSGQTGQPTSALVSSCHATGRLHEQRFLRHPAYEIEDIGFGVTHVLYGQLSGTRQRGSLRFSVKLIAFFCRNLFPRPLKQFQATESSPLLQVDRAMVGHGHRRKRTVGRQVW